MFKIAKVWLCRALLVFSVTQVAITVLYVLLPSMSLVLNGGKRTDVGSLRGMAGGTNVPRRPRSNVKYIPYNLSENAYPGRNKLHKCPELSWEVPNGKFLLEDDKKEYFVKMGPSMCAIHGSLTQTTSTTGVPGCRCKEGWFGDHCSIPKSVIDAKLPKRFTFHPRLKKPRRIIQAFPFNMEFAMLEARLHEFGDLVDVFMILESNYTAYGDPKDLRLLGKLREGQYKKYACKIVHVFLDYFPEEGYKNGWIEDDLLRNYIVSHGVKNQLSGLRHDDIFILTDADELPKRETVVFLKLHDGYPEPFGYNYQWNTWGFFWQPISNSITHVYAGLTVGMLLHIFSNKAIKIRGSEFFLQNEGANELSWYLNHGKNISVYFWSFGSVIKPAGWHCSWCCEPECIQTKLVSAQNGDFPRWGDFPEKREINYITSLVKNGVWFDNVSNMLKTDYGNSTEYAPKFFLENKNRFSYLLNNPYAHTSPATSTPKKERDLVSAPSTKRTNIKQSTTTVIPNLFSTQLQKTIPKGLP